MARGLILAARHPRPAMSARICYGRLDVPLAEPPERGADAVEAAVDAALAEAGVADDPLTRIVCSPQSRAHAVAEALARRYGAKLHADDRLREMDFGAWEGQPWASLPRGELDAWAADTLGYRPPGGGETVTEVLARVRRAWTGLASSAAATLVVTHAGPIRCLLAVSGQRPLDQAIRAEIAYGQVLKLG